MKRPGRHTLARVRAQRARHRERHLAFRIVFAVAGFSVVGGGVLLLVLPGPGLLLIVVGLAMLALEFAWAERLLESALVRFERAAEKVRQVRRPSDETPPRPHPPEKPREEAL